MNAQDKNTQRLSVDIQGLDDVLHGGLISGYAYLVRGGPGTGKTTLGLHFLNAGVAANESVMCVTLGEPESRIRRNGKTLNLDTDKIHFLDLSPTPEYFSEVESYDIFSPGEVEREPTTAEIVSAMEAVQPTRIFVDSVTQFRYLSSDTFHYRKQVLSFLRFLTSGGATVMFTSESSTETPDSDLQFLSDGIIDLSMDERERYLEVTKFRGSSFAPGRHAMQIVGDGIEVYQKLIPKGRDRLVTTGVVSSGIPAMDAMLHGGLEKSTITIISGPSGTGKTTLGLQFMKEAAGRGEKSIMYTFEEEPAIVTHRSDSVNIPASSMQEQGTLSLVKVEPLRYTPDEFAHVVQRDVEERDAKLVMIDSVSGYKLSLHGRDLVRHLHSLSKYLQSKGVTVILATETRAILGDFRVTDVDLSYLADNIVFLRYLEIDGEMRKAIGILKKRMSDFEKVLREFAITAYGIQVGEPLMDLRGILTGTPDWIGPEADGQGA